MRRKNFAMYLKSWRTWLFLGYISLFMYLSLTPTNELGILSKLWKYDKVVHFIEYLGMGFLMINMLMIHPLKKAHWQFAIIFLLLFPLFDELLQNFTPRRIPDVYDCIADICGGFLGAYLRKII